MLSRAFEWYRIVNAQPSSSTIDNRKAAAVAIVKAIDEADNWNLALDCATGVVVGFDAHFTSESPSVQVLVAAIRTNESAFPQGLSENALELRSCAAIALGEILIREGSNGVPTSEALLIASVLRSGMGTRPSPRGRHLKQLLDELDGAAAKALNSGALSARRRLSTFADQLGKLAEPADLTTAWKSLVPAFQAAVRQAAIDREELNILWWMFAGTSTTAGKPIAQMPTGVAVLYCGAELGSQCLLPPALSLEAMVRRACEAGRRGQGLTDTSIEAIGAEWDAELPRVLAADEDVASLARAHPSLFPLSWLCQRLLTSKGAAGWVDEFERTTGIPSKHRCSPANWAVQVFRERVAYRTYADSLTA